MGGDVVQYKDCGKPGTCQRLFPSQGGRKERELPRYSVTLWKERTGEEPMDKTVRIGNVEIPSRLALAPMAGVTDAAFRRLCASLGAGLT